jgi:Fe-Mn family superoxide dismutase
MNQNILATAASALGLNDKVSELSTLNDIGKLKPPFELTALPYPAGSLAPTIDEKTMEIHHGKHHQTYVDNLNKIVTTLKETSELQTILNKLSGKEAALRNNAGGHWNHTFFWTLLTGDKEKQKIPERLSKEIEQTFGSIKKFKEQFEKAGLAQFGSGWAWLVRDNNGSLAITTTSNQDNPLMDIAEVKGRPIFTVDVWEHAYYLSYQNRRADYLKSIWSVVNWVQVDAYDKEVTAH